MPVGGDLPVDSVRRRGDRQSSRCACDALAEANLTETDNALKLTASNIRKINKIIDDKLQRADHR